ncbi:MAG: hypothetical protein ABEN55_00630 [Bradymonadaceae bacterium]
MAWNYEEIKNRLTADIDPNQNDDPDNKYDTDNDGTDENERPDVSVGEWEALFHYLDNAIRDIIRPELRVRYEATALHGGAQSVGSGGEIMSLDSWLQSDSIYTLSGNTVEVSEAGTYEIACAVSGQSNGGTINYRVYPEVSTDGGTSWSQIDTIQAFDFITADLEYGTASIPSFSYDLGAGDLVRVIVDFFDGTGTSLETENGQLTLTKVGA